MLTRPSPVSGKAKPVEKRVKGTNETSRLFLDVEELVRRSPTTLPSRYVE